eukprot:TRINITY_DN4050_c0_g1_i2.p1 TRINITY_DN4050_c0_g1~~TRINITY_DN4050_c0_g1_i2.p1  ORF type:complete len:541 (+),score=144.49 TRINITY_DN4050_c0_g1_i2:67-1689(+)
MSAPGRAAVCFGAWEQHTRGIGSKLLRKWGFEGPGHGLGARGQGTPTPLQAVQRRQSERAKCADLVFAACDTEPPLEPARVLVQQQLVGLLPELTAAPRMVKNEDVVMQVEDDAGPEQTLELHARLCAAARALHEVGRAAAADERWRLECYEPPSAPPPRTRCTHAIADLCTVIEALRAEGGEAQADVFVLGDVFTQLAQAYPYVYDFYELGRVCFVLMLPSIRDAVVSWLQAHREVDCQEVLVLQQQQQPAQPPLLDFAATDRRVALFFQWKQLLRTSRSVCLADHHALCALATALLAPAFGRAVADELQAPACDHVAVATTVSAWGDCIPTLISDTVAPLVSRHVLSLLAADLSAPAATAAAAAWAPCLGPLLLDPLCLALRKRIECGEAPADAVALWAPQLPHRALRRSLIFSVLPRLQDTTLAVWVECAAPVLPESVAALSPVFPWFAACNAAGCGRSWRRMFERAFFARWLLSLQECLENTGEPDLAAVHSWYVGWKTALTEQCPMLLQPLPYGCLLYFETALQLIDAALAQADA